MTNQLTRINPETWCLELKSSMVDIPALNLRASSASSSNEYGSFFPQKTVINMMIGRAEELDYICRSNVLPTQLYHLANTNFLVAAVRVGGRVQALKGNKNHDPESAVSLSEEVFLNVIAEGAPNLVRLTRGGGFNSKTMDFWFTMEMLRMLDMSRRAMKGHPIPIESTWCYMYDMIIGLRGLHLRNICHRDIKAANTTEDYDSGTFKIGDLGSATIMSTAEDRSTSTGTEGWSKPLRVIPEWLRTLMSANERNTTDPSAEHKIADFLKRFVKKTYNRTIDYRSLALTAFDFQNFASTKKRSDHK